MTTDHTTPSCNKEYSRSTLGDIPDLQLHGYSDAAFADSVNRKSTSGYIYKLAGGLVLYKLSKQSILTTSTTEAKYIAITHAAKEALWLRQLLTDLSYTGKDLLPIHLYGDNQPAIDLTRSDDYHARTKHFDLYWHYIRDKVQSGVIHLQHVPTSSMVADGLTKPLSTVQFRNFVKQLGLVQCDIDTKLK